MMALHMNDVKTRNMFAWSDFGATWKYLVHRKREVHY